MDANAKGLKTLAIMGGLAFFASGPVARLEACCSLGPAHFNATKGLAAEASKNGQKVHLLAYQNVAQNKDGAAGGNAMLLPIPAKYGTMGQTNIIDTRSASHFLDDMDSSSKAVSRGVASVQSFGVSKGGVIAVFEHDIYTIVLAQDAAAIPAALAQVPENKRPKMNKEIFDAYAKWYKGWTFALCCFNNKDRAKAKPMLWWYEPSDPDHLFFPALDAHSGKPPDMKAMVGVDHALFFSSLAGKEYWTVNYSDGKIEAELKKLLPKKIESARYHGSMRQGDFRVDLSELRKGKFRVQRAVPDEGRLSDIGQANDLIKFINTDNEERVPSATAAPVLRKKN